MRKKITRVTYSEPGEPKTDRIRDQDQIEKEYRRRMTKNVFAYRTSNRKIANLSCNVKSDDNIDESDRIKHGRNESISSDDSLITICETDISFTNEKSDQSVMSKNYGLRPSTDEPKSINIDHENYFNLKIILNASKIDESLNHTTNQSVTNSKTNENIKGKKASSQLPKEAMVNKGTIGHKKIIEDCKNRTEQVYSFKSEFKDLKFSDRHLEPTYSPNQNINHKFQRDSGFDEQNELEETYYKRSINFLNKLHDSFMNITFRKNRSNAFFGKMFDKNNKNSFFKCDNNKNKKFSLNKFFMNKKNNSISNSELRDKDGKNVINEETLEGVCLKNHMENGKNSNVCKVRFNSKRSLKQDKHDQIYKNDRKESDHVGLQEKILNLKKFKEKIDDYEGDSNGMKKYIKLSLKISKEIDKKVNRGSVSKADFRSKSIMLSNKFNQLKYNKFKKAFKKSKLSHNNIENKYSMNRYKCNKLRSKGIKKQSSFKNYRYSSSLNDKYNVNLLKQQDTRSDGLIKTRNIPFNNLKKQSIQSNCLIDEYVDPLNSLIKEQDVSSSRLINKINVPVSKLERGISLKCPIKEHDIPLNSSIKHEDIPLNSLNKQLGNPSNNSTKQNILSKILLKNQENTRPKKLINQKYNPRSRSLIKQQNNTKCKSLFRKDSNMRNLIELSRSSNLLSVKTSSRNKHRIGQDRSITSKTSTNKLKSCLNFWNDKFINNKHFKEISNVSKIKIINFNDNIIEYKKETGGNWDPSINNLLTYNKTKTTMEKLIDKFKPERRNTLEKSVALNPSEVLYEKFMKRKHSVTFKMPNKFKNDFESGGRKLCSMTGMYCGSHGSR